MEGPAKSHFNRCRYRKTGRTVAIFAKNLTKGLKKIEIPQKFVFKIWSFVIKLKICFLPLFRTALSPVPSLPSHAVHLYQLGTDK